MAFQLSDDIMDITATQLELGKEPGLGHAGGRVHGARAARAAPTIEHREELPGSCGHGPPDGELLDRALEIVRGGGSIDHARRAVTAEVGRAIGLARSLPAGPAQHALEQLARFLAARCGAEQTAVSDRC